MESAGTESISATSQVIVRPACDTDLDWLIDQVKDFSAFNATVYPLFDDEIEVRAGLLNLMTDHFMRVASRGGERLGFVAGYYVRHPLNQKLITLCEVFWWVAKNHRHSRAGVMLLNEYITWGKANANWITFALQSNSPVKEEALLKRGFHRHESSYLLEVV